MKSCFCGLMPKITVFRQARSVECTAECPIGHIGLKMSLKYSKTHKKEFVIKEATKEIKKAWDRRITEEKALIKAKKGKKK